jgi:hypothetical protein
MGKWTRIPKNVMGFGGGINVAHTQFSGPPSGEVMERVGKIVEESRKWITLAAMNLDDWSGAARSAAKVAFLNENLDPGDRATIKKALISTAVGIVGSHDIKLSDTGNYVNVYNAPKVDSSAVTDMKTGKGQHIGHIHVSREKVENSPAYAMITYIHEATHRYAGTVDYGDSGYFFLTQYLTTGTVQWRAPGLTAAQALTNADSYALFVAETCKAAGKTFPA